MKTLLTALWVDEFGLIISAELVLVGTVGVLAMLSGLVCVRDAVNAELYEVSDAMRSINQSYYYSGMHGCISQKCGVSSYTAGSNYLDVNNGCDIQSDLCCRPGVVVEREHQPAPGSIAVPREMEPVPCPTPAKPCPEVDEIPPSPKVSRKPLMM